MKFSWFLVSVALIFFSTRAYSQATVVSDFATNADGWTSTQSLGTAVNYTTTGGNPNGYISAQTPGSIVLGAGTLWIPYFLEAPAKFEGNKSAYYGGGISLDLSQTTTGTPTQYAAVVLTTAAGVSLWFYPNTLFQPPAFGSWTTFTVPLSATGEWKTTNSPTGTAASATELQNVLANLFQLQVQGLYRNANVVTRFDNITMRPPITITTQPTSSTVCDGVTATFTALGTNNPNITYQWQLYNPFSGAVTNLTNTGGYSGTTTGTLSVNTTGNFGAGYYRARISGTGVSDVYTTAVTLTINPLPAAPTTTGDANCGPFAPKLSATGGTLYRWYTVATGGTAIAGATGNSYSPGTITTTTNFWVATDNGTCQSTRTIVTATVNTIPTAPTTTGNSRCGTGTVTLNASGGSAGQYRWYTVATGGTAISGQTAATYTTPSIAVTTDYWVAINNGPCESARRMVTATVNTIPAAPTTTGAPRCGAGTVTLTAAGGSAGQYRWYTVATGGTAIPGQTAATYTTPSLTTSTDYWVAINNGSCEGARTMVTATINTVPTAPTTTGASRCGPGTVTLTASGGAAGQYRWYTVATGGIAISGEVNATYVPSITGTTNYYAAINNGLCESTRTLVVATMNTIPAAPTTTGASRCGTGNVTLTASGGAAGQYRWYTVPTGGVAISGETNSTYVVSIASTTTFYVSINNGSCEGARSSVVATWNSVPTAPTATGGSHCGPGTVTLTAAGGAAGQYRWYTVATGGTAISGQVNATLTTGNLTTSANFFVSINNGTCESNRTLVVATINNLPPAPGVFGAAGCDPSSVTLTASGGASGLYRWYTVPTGGTAIAGEVNSTYTTPTLSATTSYYVSINNGTCEGGRSTVVATINSLPPPPTTTDGNACAPGVATLSASGAGAGQYRWYTVPTGGTAISGVSGPTFDTPSLTSNTTYYVSIYNGCEGSRASVTANLIQPPSSPTVNVTGESVSCVPKSFNVTASGGADGEYRWYTQATGGIPDVNISASFTTPLLSATTTFYAALKKSICESVRVPVTLTIGGQQCANNSAPVIKSSQETTAIGGEVVFDLADLISDADNNLDLSTLTVVTQPQSGATATFDDKSNTLVINYKDAPLFTGIDEITIKVCDAFGACSEQTLKIDVTASITIYNALSPNKDGKNDVFFIDHIDVLESTRNNHVMIFNRWGDLVWEGRNYNNTTVVFTGISKNNAELPSGTYYYKIKFDKNTETGYLELKR